MIQGFYIHGLTSGVMIRLGEELGQTSVSQKLEYYYVGIHDF